MMAIQSYHLSKPLLKTFKLAKKSQQACKTHISLSKYCINNCHAKSHTKSIPLMNLSTAAKLYHNLNITVKTLIIFVYFQLR